MNIFRKLIKTHSKLSFIIINRDGKILYANPISYRRLGYTKDEFYRIPAYELNPNFTREQFDKAFEDSQEKGLSLYQTTHVKKNKSHYPLEISLQGIELNGENYMIAISYKATHMRKYQASLIENEKKQRNIIDSVPVMMWITNRENNFTYFNKVWLNFYGTTIAKELNGQWDKRILPVHRKRFQSVYKEAFRERKSFEVEYKIKAKGNKYKWILHTGVPNFSEKGYFIGFIGSATDITSNKLVEEKKDEFLSIASHELKNPLTTIKGYTQLLSDVMAKNDPDKAKQYLEKTITFVNKLDELVTELLDVSRIQAGKLEINISLINITQLVQSIVNDINRSIDTHEISLTFEDNIYTYGDKLKLEQVFLNLLSNAIKYSPNGKKIDIRLTKISKYISIEIQDYGIGIPEKDQKLIFSRFYRTEHSEKNFAGLGIGLYISKEIIDLHEGKISVKSEMNKGSCFTVLLPSKSKK